MKELINKIENSNFLSNDQKAMMIDSISVGGSVTVDVRKVQTKLKLAILEILFANNEPLTITEITDNFAVHNGYSYTVQRFSAMANQLNKMGLLEKTYISTGNYLIFGRGRKEPERIAKFSFKKA
jgi:hypothetical protein